MDKCSSWTEYEHKLNEIKEKIASRHADTLYMGLSEHEISEISDVLLRDVSTLIEHNNFEALRTVGDIIDLLVKYTNLADLPV